MTSQKPLFQLQTQECEREEARVRVHMLFHTSYDSKRVAAGGPREARESSHLHMDRIAMGAH
jgi:hypothetical protein